MTGFFFGALGFEETGFLLDGFLTTVVVAIFFPPKISSIFSDYAIASAITGIRLPSTGSLSWTTYGAVVHGNLKTAPTT